VDMISASDLAYAKLNGDELTTANVNDPTKTETDSASDLVRKREEDSRDILRAMDQSEPIKQTTQAASAIGESMTNLQKIMSAGNEGTKRQAMVDFARAEAEPMLKLLRDPNTAASVNQALIQLRTLKEANLGVALGGVEKEIDARIQSLEQFAELLQSGRVADIFETIMDKSKFDADTWARWFSTEFPKILAAIVVATAVVVTVISLFATCGAATPLWAVAAAGAAGGIIGAELGAEGVRAGRKLLDEDVRSGRLAYSNRSRLGKYLEGQEVLDPVTGKKVPLEFIKDVANPYMQEFAFSFVTTYATIGLGSIAASRMSALAQNSKWVQAFAQRSPMANRVMTYMSQIGDDAVRAGTEKTSFMKQWFNESIDELKDEFIREKGVEAVLAQIDGKLGPAAAFLVTLARGFKPLKVPKSPGTMLGSFSVENTTSITEVRMAAEAQGYPSIVDSGTYLTVTDHDGHTFELHPDKPAPVLVNETKASSPAETTTDLKAPETNIEVDTREKNLRERIGSVSESQLGEEIQKINDEHPKGFEESRFSVVRNTANGMVTVNENGKLELVAINQGNAVDVLKRVKDATDFDAEHSGYELRQECLRRNPDIPTHIAYTYGDVPTVKTEMKAYIADPVNWIPEKRQFHEQLFKSTMERVRENSKQMRPESVGAEKVVVMLRGNTAAGKSSTLRKAKAPRLQELNASPDGAINPDDMKSFIRSQEKAGEKNTVTHNQAHSEGSMMAEKIIDQAFNEELNMVVIDKRFASTADVAEVTEMARHKGYKVVMVDVDAELETSVARVHGGEARGRSYPGRSPDGDDPVVPFNRIEEGYNAVVQDREEVMKIVDEYYLYKTDVIGSDEAVLVAEHQDGSVTVHDQKLFEHVTRDVKQEDQFVRHTMDNLRKTSRTSQGTVDTSATKVKAESVAVSGQEAAQKANLNYESVMRRLYKERMMTFDSPSDVRQFVEQVAKDVNKGILKDGLLMRRADSEKFPYTRIDDLPRATNEFYQELYNRLSDPQQDPIELAAWLEFNVDLSHHLFEDGCGKVAKALSSWAMARRGLPPPTYNGRSEYYAHAPKQNAANNPDLRQQQLDEWIVYYRSLNNGKPHE